MGSDIQCCFGKESRLMLKNLKIEIEFLKLRILEQKQCYDKLVNKLKHEHQKEISRLTYEKHESDALLLQEQYARQEMLDRCRQHTEFLETELRVACLTKQNEKLKNPPLEVQTICP